MDSTHVEVDSTHVEVDSTHVEVDSTHVEVDSTHVESSSLAKPRIALLFKGCGRGIVSMVEQWSPKPEVKGSNPFSPDLFICLFSVWWPRVFCLDGFSPVFSLLYYIEHFLYTDLSLV